MRLIQKKWVKGEGYVKPADRMDGIWGCPVYGPYVFFSFLGFVLRMQVSFILHT